MTIENSKYDFESHLDEATKRLKAAQADIANIETNEGQLNNLNVDFEMSKLDSQSFEKIRNLPGESCSDARRWLRSFRSLMYCLLKASTFQ